MNRFKFITKPLMWSMGFLAVVWAAGCSAGRDPILGNGGIAVLPPRVVSVTPVNASTGVSISSPGITATFNEGMAPITGGATFTVTHAVPALSATGTVSLDGTRKIATFTLAAGTTLAPSSLFTATVTGAKSLATGLPIVGPYAWTFTTGPAPDTTRPRVTLTNPATQIPPTTGVPINTTLSAGFTETMAPASIMATGTFTVTGPGGSAVAGTVTYASQTAVFTPSSNLAIFTTYTATITTAATDLAGNALAGNQAALPAASNYVWTFTTVPPPDTTRPRVTITNPATRIPPTTGVATNTTIAAAFTEEMALASIIATGTFTVTGPGGSAVAGGVTYASQSALFTPTILLAVSTTYTATISTAATDLAGNALAGNQAPLPGASNYVWSFTTAPAPDTTRPRVALTVPATTTPGPTPGVPTNTAITAIFTEDMNPATIGAASFTVTTPGPGVSPSGTVSYIVGTRTAIFTPDAPLAISTTYTATITSAATDLAGNALAGNQAALPAASNYVWTFTTATPVIPSNVTVLSTVPADNQIGVCPDDSINATFNVPSGLRMNPATINTATFFVNGPGPTFTPVIAASVQLDVPTGLIATFIPLNPLAVGVIYTARIVGGADGVKDLAIPGNTMLADKVWTFTVDPAGCVPAPNPSQLGSAAGFGIMATAAITNVPTSLVNGDVSLEPGSSCGLLPAEVNGTIHINDSVSSQARIDLLVGYNYYKTLPPGVTISGGADLGALYPLGIPPGTYTSGSTMLVSTHLTLDAGGDANAVWVFQIGSSLTTNTPLGSMSLLGGANPNNIFWVCTLDATVGVGTTFYGTIITGRDATANTGATINGRILAGATLAGTIALDSNTINVPAP